MNSSYKKITITICCPINTEIEIESQETVKEKVKNPLPPDFISFDFEEKGFINISRSDYDAWKEAYPCANIPQELAKMTQWLLANPQKARSKKLWRKFITTWLAKSHDTAFNREAYNAQPKTKGYLEILTEKGFTNLSIHNGATCYLENDKVSFERGLTHRSLSFKEKGFWDQFQNLAQSFGIKTH